MTLIALLLLAAQTAPAAAPPPAPPPAPPKVDCSDADHTALDFWVGEWDVVDTKSQVPVARSRISKTAAGCAIEENYDQTIGPGNKPMAYHGRSFSAFNSGDSTWRQFYVDTGGAALSYFGGMSGGAMVLTARAGQLATRMTIRAQPDGSVRQSGEVSRDGEKTWNPGYDFTYRRRAAT